MQGAAEAGRDAATRKPRGVEGGGAWAMRQQDSQVRRAWPAWRCRQILCMGWSSVRAAGKSSLEVEDGVGGPGYECAWQGKRGCNSLLHTQRTTLPSSMHPSPHDRPRRCNCAELLSSRGKRISGAADCKRTQWWWQSLNTSCKARTHCRARRTVRRRSARHSIAPGRINYRDTPTPTMK